MGDEVEPREPVPRRPGRSAGRPERDRLPSGRRRLPAADRRLHQPARHPARVPADRHPGLRGHGRRGQRLLGEQPADVGHQQHHDLRGRPPQRELRPRTIGAGSCSGISATGFLGGYGFNVGFTGNPVADMLLGTTRAPRLFQPAAFSVPGQPGNPREFNFMYIAPYMQDDWRVNSSLTVNLGLRWDYRSVPYETRNRMAWRNLDYAPGGLLVADAIARRGRHRRRRVLPARGRPQSGEPRSVQGIRAQARLRVAPVRGREDGGPRRLRHVLRLLGGARDRWLVGRVSVRQPRQLSAVLRTGGAAPDHGRAVSELRDPRPGDAGGQHVPGREPVAAAAQPLRPAVVDRRAARGVPQHSPRAQLHRQQGYQPADAAQHRPGRPLQRCPADGRRAQAVPELRRLHRQRLERAVELPRLQHQTRAPCALGAADVCVYLGQEHRHQVRRGRHRGDRLQRLAGVPRQPGSRARSRPVGLRRGSPPGRRASSTTCRSATASGTPAMPPAPRRRWSADGR